MPSIWWGHFQCKFWQQIWCENILPCISLTLSFFPINYSFITILLFVKRKLPSSFSQTLIALPLVLFSMSKWIWKPFFFVTSNQNVVFNKYSCVLIGRFWSTSAKLAFKGFMTVRPGLFLFHFPFFSYYNNRAFNILSVPVLHYLQLVLFIKIWTFYHEYLIIQHSLRSRGIKY